MRIGAALILLIPGLAGAHPPSLESTQDQTLVITAPAAPGGGWDQTARAMQRVLAEIEPGANVQVENVPGAAGTIGLARFIQSERGNPDALMVTGLVMVSGVIINGSPVSLSDTTPIARLTGEYEVIVVPAHSPFQSVNDLVDAFKNDPGSISWGGGSAGGTDDLLIRLLAEQVGLPASRVNYIAFSGGGAALAAVLGGQLSAAVSGYSEFAGQIASGQLRILAVSAPTRVDGIDAPSLRESGIGLDLANWRAVVAPPGLSDAEAASLTARVTRMADSAEWTATLDRFGWDGQFLTGPAFRQFLLAEQSRIEDLLRRLAETDAVGAPSFSVRVTPMTLPAAALLLLALAMASAFIRYRDVGAGSRQPGARIGVRRLTTIAAGLLALPVLFVTAGFVAASSLLFAITASALRAHPPTARTVTVDLVAGAIFATALFLLFTRGLGVSLPALPLP